MQSISHIEHPVLARSTRRAVEQQQSKKICYDKLLPYVLKTLPLLVHVAGQNKREGISYSELASMIGTGSAENANWPFAAIKLALDELKSRTEFGGYIPDITLIVTHKDGRTSGSGAFINAPKMLESEQAKLNWLQGIKDEICEFQKWPQVLASLGLKNLPSLNLGEPPEELGSRQRHGNGEGHLHKRLKNFLKDHPALVGIEDGEVQQARLEFPFWSADRVDVHFDTTFERVAIEVKTSGCDVKELKRGVYQIVKYDALVRADILAEGQTKSGRAVLALGGRLPSALRFLAERLRIEFIEDLESQMLEVDSSAY